MGSFTQLQIRRLFNGQPQAPCYWCGTILWPKEATRDHKLPRVDGGGGAVANLVLACAPCNSFRGDVPFLDFESLWAKRRSGALTVDEFEKRVAEIKIQRQVQRGSEPPKKKAERKEQQRKNRCKLCRKEGCNPGLHSITWMHKDYCPWCWAMECTPEVHVEGLERIEQ